jgi:ATP-dependent Clp protease ATP-binding subunit ClpA
VGQEQATRVLVEMFEAYRAGFCDPSKPAGVALFLGPTGTGKTHVVETFAQSLFGKKEACLVVDCAEFQHSHEISKLIGSPPGYLGHRETHPALTQGRLDAHHIESLKLSLLLFDEVEKASDSLWSLLLGILDKARLTLGDNTVVDFSKTIVVLTSNLGAREMSNRGIGFAELPEEKDQVRLEQIAISAAKSKFSPEFMNRLQHIITFHNLTPEQISQVLEIELNNLKRRFDAANFALPVSSNPRKFSLQVSPRAKQLLLDEGYSKVYGARYLKRTLERRLMQPLAKFYISSQISNGDVVVADYEDGDNISFYVHPQIQRPQGEIL